MKRKATNIRHRHEESARREYHTKGERKKDGENGNLLRLRKYNNRNEKI